MIWGRTLQFRTRTKLIEITVGGEEQTPTDEVQIVQDEVAEVIAETPIEITEENQDVTTEEN